MKKMRAYITITRVAQLLLTGVVATLTLAIVAHATQTITVPNVASVSYALAAGANSGAITPVADAPVLVMGVQTAVGNRGVGHVTMLRPLVLPNFLEWVGLESTSIAGAAITQGFSGVIGTHIVYLDFSHTVDIEVNTPTSFRIHNGNAAAQTGVVRLIW
jgi:hypothetical protein